VIPNEVVLRGTTRTFSPEVQDSIEPAMRRIVENVSAALGASATMRYERRYPATINSEAETEIAAEVLADLVGAANVRRDQLPSMGSEDFAFMLQQKPGAYIWIGNGPAAGNAMLHNPNYDFNDEILPLGASYWARLVEHVLRRQAA
jgi:hippurate hydrolase